MATLQTRNGSFRLLFQYEGKQQALTIGVVSLTEARQWKAKAENLLMRLKQCMLEVPMGCTINEFILHEGKPPTGASLTKVRNTTLDQLREAYLKVFSNGAIEANTLRTAKIHLTHIENTLGKSFSMPTLTLAKLQEHVERRGKAKVSPVTIKKEVDTFRAVWNWGKRTDLVIGAFPSNGLVYPKSDEILPFMSWDEIQRRVKAGGDAEILWECLYLNVDQVTEFLAFAKKAAAPDYLYPMLVMAAHTGARRSEMMRAQLEDIDLENAVLTIREKKRARGTCTTRRVPISKLLGEVLAERINIQPNKAYLFGDGEIELTDSQAYRMFVLLVKDSKWSVLKGFHILRHAFISTLCSKGVDQRIIDEFAGHSTEQQRKRYRHLMPQATRDAIAAAFG